MKLTLESTLHDVLQTPVGSDLVAMVGYHAGIPDAVLNNPAVGKIKLKTISKLLGDKLPVATMEHL